jgi:nucleoside-diphosphate-sugar epimerase
VGDTGFVGSNILAQAGGVFTGLYHTANISEAFGTKPDLLVFAGLRAEKFLAEKDPKKDFAGVKEAFANIERINPKKVVLISTVDVYPKPVGVDEKSTVGTEGLSAYGLNRYCLEKMVRSGGWKFLIVRLPGLYGRRIKKNFIYDLIHTIPALLTEQKLRELSEREKTLCGYYEDQKNGYWKCRARTPEEQDALKAVFSRLGFSAVNFTDSRGVFQFYPLNCLWGHIRRALNEEIPILNLATEPVKISDLHLFVTGRKFSNEIAEEIPHYDFRTQYAEDWGGKNGYLFGSDFIMRDIRSFVEEYREP